MKVVGVLALQEFIRQHADAGDAIRVWLAEAEDASWATPQDIKARYVSASFLSDNRVIFNMKGNSYRLLVQVSYKLGIVAVVAIGTHAEYDRWKL